MYYLSLCNIIHMFIYYFHDIFSMFPQLKFGVFSIFNNNNNNNNK